MTNTARKPVYDKARMRQQIEMMQKNLETLKARNNANAGQTVQPIDPFNAQIINFPTKEAEPVVEVEENKKVKVQKTKSEKSKLVTSPTLLLNNIRIALLDRKIAREKELNEEEAVETKKSIISKVTSAGSFLISLPKKIVNKFKFMVMSESKQVEYGENYYNRLEEKGEKERLKNIELADELEEENREAKRKESIDNMIAALKENDKQMIEAKKAELDELRYEPIEDEEIPEAAILDDNEETIEEEIDGGILRR